MRRRQLFWRIFFYAKRSGYRKITPLFRLLILKRVRDITPNKDYNFFINNNTLETVLNPHNKHIQHNIKEIKKTILPIIQGRRFCFLNKCITFHNKIEWHCKKRERLWMYNLHYFDYAVDMGFLYITENDDKVFDNFKYLVSNWIKNNSKIGCGTGWEPYPVSLRISNWIYSYSLFASKIENDLMFKHMFLHSIAIQTEFLSKNVEFHVCRNHLIKNGKALLMSGLFFDGKRASSWKNSGMKILSKEADEQVLDDGGHFERSPMYHMIVLQDYIEMYILTGKNGIKFNIHSDKLKSMLNFLAEIVHPDNQIPLLNDSAFNIAREPGELLFIGRTLFSSLPTYNRFYKMTLYTFILTGNPGLEIMKRESQSLNLQTESQEQHLCNPVKQSTMFSNSGFCIMRNDNRDRFMIITCKEPSPQYLPGHSHADMLSYELSLGIKRFIVDSGTYNYNDGANRNYFRGTSGHNTLTVNNNNQSELWGTFGIARRATLKTCSLKRIDSSVIFEGAIEHALFKNRIIHQRSIYFLDHKFWIILDTIKTDHQNPIPYTAKSFMHIHPDLKVNTDAQNVIIKDGNTKLQIHNIKILKDSNRRKKDGLKIMTSKKIPVKGWYSPYFGKKVQNQVIELSKHDQLPIYLGYVIYPSYSDEDDVYASCKITEEDNVDSKNSILDIRVDTMEVCYTIKRRNKDILIHKVTKSEFTLE